MPETYLTTAPLRGTSNPSNGHRRNAIPDTAFRRTGRPGSSRRTLGGGDPYRPQPPYLRHHLACRRGRHVRPGAAGPDSYSLAGSDGACCRLAPRAPPRSAANIVCLTWRHRRQRRPCAPSGRESGGGRSRAGARGGGGWHPDRAPGGDPLGRPPPFQRQRPSGDAILWTSPPNSVPEGGAAARRQGGPGRAWPARGRRARLMVIPHASIIRFLMSAWHGEDATGDVGGASSLRLRIRTDQRAASHARCLRTIVGTSWCVSVTPGGPAEHAGLRLGDVL